MATQAQTAANRKNARRSTGPRTPEGKAIASGNALRHGLLAKEVVLEDEDEALFRERRDAMHAHLDSQGALEDMLVDRMVGCAWRLRRLGHIEASVLQYHVFDDEVSRASALVKTFAVESSILDDGVSFFQTTITDERQHAAALSQREEATAARGRETLAIAFTNAADPLAKLSRYEVAIERIFYRALQELQRLQAARRSRNGGTPPVIDVTGSASAN